MTETIAPTTEPKAARGITIAGVILAFLVPLVGLILSIVGLVQARKVGQKNGLAIAGIIISVVWPIIVTIIIAVAVTAGISAQCANLDSGVNELSPGVTVTCP